MRVCGGWVRDKLLQKDNEDIDICLDTCSGQEFASELKAWFDSKGASSLCSSIGLIKASSEKSKHLETAVVRITVTGEDVPPNTIVSLDFVQLRSETYADESRVPVARAATAEEDALRRDFTINAMFVDDARPAPQLPSESHPRARMPFNN
jgi:tRNA nucleotidyltransferase (CCA-adding enzyme)